MKTILSILRVMLGIALVPVFVAGVTMLVKIIFSVVELTWGFGNETTQQLRNQSISTQPEISNVDT